MVGDRGEEWQGRQPLLRRSRCGGGQGGRVAGQATPSPQEQVGAVEGMEQGWGKFGLRGGSSVNGVG